MENNIIETIKLNDREFKLKSAREDELSTSLGETINLLGTKDNRYHQLITLSTAGWYRVCTLEKFNCSFTLKLRSAWYSAQGGNLTVAVMIQQTSTAPTYAIYYNQIHCAPSLVFDKIALRHTEGSAGEVLFHYSLNSTNPVYVDIYDLSLDGVPKINVKPIEDEPTENIFTPISATGLIASRAIADGNGDTIISSKIFNSRGSTPYIPTVVVGLNPTDLPDGYSLGNYVYAKNNADTNTINKQDMINCFYIVNPNETYGVESGFCSINWLVHGASTGHIRNYYINTASINGNRTLYCQNCIIKDVVNCWNTGVLDGAEIMGTIVVSKRRFGDVSNYGLTIQNCTLNNVKISGKVTIGEGCSGSYYDETGKLITI